MGLTSENVARRFGITRLEQDQAAVSCLIPVLCGLFFVYIYETMYGLLSHDMLLAFKVLIFILLCSLSHTERLLLQQLLVNSKRKLCRFIQR
jgi:hypothetical protein